MRKKKEGIDGKRLQEESDRRQDRVGIVYSLCNFPTPLGHSNHIFLRGGRSPSQLIFIAIEASVWFPDQITCGPLTRGKREIAPMIGPHVDVEPSRPRNLLQLPLRSRRPPQVIKSAHNPQHSRQSSPTRLPAKTRMRSQPVMDVSIQGPVDADGIRLREEFGFAVRTDEAAEDFVARFDRDRATSIVNRRGYRGLAIGAKCSVEPDAFHCVVQELVVGLGAFDVGPFVDFREMFLALV